MNAFLEEEDCIPFYDMNYIFLTWGHGPLNPPPGVTPEKRDKN